MVLSCIVTRLPQSLVFVAHSKFFRHIQTFDCIQHQRIYRTLHYRELRVDRKQVNIVEVTSIMGENSTDIDAKDSSKMRLLTGCGPDQLFVLRGGVVALGKFDALHIGHRALAIQASKMGHPFLLSFSGMAEVLGWEKRLPIVAPCDRKRIMSVWATVCRGIVPQEYYMEFAKVRSLSPREFVEKLAFELHVQGVVAGANYRFGYKAAGDASDLVQLCGEYGLKVFIVDPVMDKSGEPSLISEEMKENIREKGQISSTRVRKALSGGDMNRVAELLGRHHRLVLAVDGYRLEANTLVAPMAGILNQPPREGIYSSRVLLGISGSNGMVAKVVTEGDVRIDATHVEVTLHDRSFDESLEGQTYLGLDLQNRISV